MTTNTPASVSIARLVYFILCGFAGAALVSVSGFAWWWGLAGGCVLAVFFILMEIVMRDFTLRGFTTGIFGLAVGLLCAWLLTRVGVSQLLDLWSDEWKGGLAGKGSLLSLTLNVAMYASLGFLGAVLALRSNREDFAFVIPYVRFRQDSASGQPLLVDTEVLIDGRLPRLLASGFLNGRLIVPRFVLDELQVMANSPSAGKRQRGQRGLEILQSIQDNPAIPVSTHQARGVAEDDSMHGRLIQTARMLTARLLTTDENLTKVAHLQVVEVLNLNDLMEALKPSVVVGERLRLALVRTGKDEHQAVGYMPDGTMIVVNHAISKIGTTQDVTVISMLETSAGQMVFAELTDSEEAVA